MHIILTWEKYAKYIKYYYSIYIDFKKNYQILDQQTAQQIPVTQEMLQHLHVSQTQQQHGQGQALSYPYPQHQQEQLRGQSIIQRIASSGGQQMQPTPTMSVRPSMILGGMLATGIQQVK